MSYEPMNADALVERRRLRRSRSGWRIATVLFAVLAITAIVGQMAGLNERLLGRGEHVARVDLTGFIAFDDAYLELLEDLAEDDDVKAVILTIDSPGGGVVAGEAIYTELRTLAEEKPVVAVIEAVGTSAAYMAAMASEHIIARNSSIVGSIGVLVQFPEVSELLDTVGVTMYELRSGELKAAPSTFAPPSEEALAELEGLINETFDWFVAQVADRRGLSEARIRGFEGTVFTGSQGVENGLVDAIGGEDQAIAYLGAEHGISEEMDIIDRAPARPIGLAGAPAAVARLVLQDNAAIEISGEGIRETLRDAMLLDGLLSVWHGR